MRLFQVIKRYYRSFLYVCKIALIQFSQTAGIFVIAYINNRPWELILLVVGYSLCKFIFVVESRKTEGKKTNIKAVHYKSIALCTATTWAAFYILTKISPTYSISTIIQPLLGFGLAYYSYYIGSLKKRAEK